MEDYKAAIMTKVIKTFWEYAAYLPTIILVASMKFFYSKVMGKKLSKWEYFFSYCLTVCAGLVSVPEIKHLPEKYQNLALIAVTLLARDLITWVFSNWRPWLNYLLRYKAGNKESEK